MVAIRVYNGLFGPNPTVASLRMGDLIALCNFLEYLREKTDNPILQMYVPDDVVFPSYHCIEFRNWLEFNTNYITTEPDSLIELQVPRGTDATYPHMINLWNIRKNVDKPRQNVFHIEDRVILPGAKIKSNTLVICPLMDAPYNADRNWSLDLLQKLLLYFEDFKYENKVIICKDPIEGLDLLDNSYHYSHNFLSNLNYVRECRTYIGGDTGFSHFASAISPGVRNLYYLYPTNTYGTTWPFYTHQGFGHKIMIDNPYYNVIDQIRDTMFNY